MSDLLGRHVLVVGAASGIGRATARACAVAGARVAVMDRVPCPYEHDAAIVADVQNAAAVHVGVERAVARIGGIDGVIYCAGIDLDASLEDTVDDDWNRVLDVNLTGAMRVCRAATRAFPQSGGTIVLIASGAGLRPLPRRTAYCAAKGGLVMFAKALALDLAEQKIRVNALCPGPVDTPMFRATWENEPNAQATLDKTLERYAIKRVAAADEIAAAALFLTSNASSFITGVALAVDGGRTFH
jgi:NAD(P)-dependent dehydrogenase (short-subunit alcohol dehydrogenase family)